LLGFGVLRLAQHKEREGAGAAYLEDALVAGKGLGRRSPSRRRQGRRPREEIRNEFLFERREMLFFFLKGEKGKVGEEKQREEMNLRP